MRKWLRVQFAQGDQFSSVQVEADNPTQPNVAAIFATRSNHILEAMQVGPLRDSLASKFFLDVRHGDHIVGGVWVAANECGDPHSTPSITLRFPPGPSQMQTRAVAQAFIDCYNARLTSRVLGLLSTTVRYSDFAYSKRRTVTITDRSTLIQWLRARFREHDTLGQVVIVPDNGAAADRATLHVERTNASLSGKNLSAIPATVTITVGAPLYDRITRVQIGADNLP
jgi:hypothetical protein